MVLPRKSPLRVLGTHRPVERLKNGALRLWAPAKINLNLLVGKSRPDGYHQLDSYVAKVTLYDRIVLRDRRDGRITFACRGADCGPDADNLALRAANILRQSIGATGSPNRQSEPGVAIELLKRIPPGKGLGGGSSDAATVLCGLNELWQLGRSAADLTTLAQGLGSDVPLFLGPPAMRMRGRGEITEQVHVASFVALLILSDYSCSTSQVYGMFDKLFGRTGVSPVEGSHQIQLDERLFTLPPSTWRDRLVNDLKESAMRVCPPLEQLRREVASAIPLPVHMTGSGSALFVLCDNAKELARAFEALPPRLRRFCLAVRSI